MADTYGDLIDDAMLQADNISGRAVNSANHTLGLTFAMLALAHEQRAANLIALLNTPPSYMARKVEH